MRRTVYKTFGWAVCSGLLLTMWMLWAIQAPQKAAGPRVRYAIVGGGAMSSAALFATVDGKSYQVIPKSQKKCLNIVSQRDFDGSGTVSALVEHSIACGGTAVRTRSSLSPIPAMDSSKSARSSRIPGKIPRSKNGWAAGAWLWSPTTKV